MSRVPLYHDLERKGAMDHLSLFVFLPASTSRNTLDHRRTIGKVVLIALEQNDTLADWNYFFKGRIEAGRRKVLERGIQFQRKIFFFFRGSC